MSELSIRFIVSFLLCVNKIIGKTRKRDRKLYVAPIQDYRRILIRFKNRNH
mgnify:CR=1 FL=1